MKLQLALDTLSFKESIDLLDLVHQYIDIIEVGTPFLIEEGLKPIREFKKRYPNNLILADAKIMDAGEYESNLCFQAGADLVTVLGATNDITIIEAVKAAKTYNGAIMIDMIAIQDLNKRCQEIDQFGVDYICVHTAFDVQKSGENPLAELAVVNSLIKNSKSAVAGGLKYETVKEVLKEGCEIIVVGGGIINERDQVEACKKIRRLIDYEK